MDQVSLADVAAIVGGALQPEGVTGRTVSSVSIHSDRLPADSLFFALQGTSDGHAYVERALHQGAIGAVVARDRLDAIPPEAGPLVVVDDTLAALQNLATWWRSQLTATVVAVVGSNGKTVTKDALVTLLAAVERAYGSPGSYNSQLGVALSILQCPSDAAICVFEAAATQPGEMAALRRMLAPDHVVFTGLGPRHQQNFGSRENYATELLSIGAELSADKWFLTAERDPEIRALINKTCDARLYTVDDASRFPQFSDVRAVDQALLVRVAAADVPVHEILVPTASHEVLSDVHLALCAASLLTTDQAALVAALAEYAPMPTRMQMWRRPDGARVVGELATADPLALSSGIRTARSLAEARGRTLMILGDPLRGLTESNAAAIAASLVNEGVEVICGLDVPAHDAIDRLVRALAEQKDVPVRMHRLGNDDQLRRFVAAELQPGDVALVHVPRDSYVSDAWMRLVDNATATRLYIDLAAVQSNVAAFRQLIGPHRKFMGVVKANAYGTDMVTIAQCLRDAGADWLGVATTEEGVALRRAGIQMPVLVFLGLPGEMDRLVRHRLTPLVYSWETLAAVEMAALTLEHPVEIHLEIDSGMHRTGLYPKEATEALAKLRDIANVSLTGLMTHLGCPDDPNDDDLTREQLARFEQVSRAAEDLGFSGLLRHAAATAATIRFPEARYDMVRIGIGMYGVQPSTATSALMTLTPGVGLVSKVIEIQDMEPGERVGYGGLHQAKAVGERVATVPAGYYDSVPRSFRMVGSVLIDGRPCRIAGNISMDSMAVDLSDQPGVQIGTDVLIFGHHAGHSVPLEEAAATMHTVPHELLTRVGPRVQRIFTSH